MAFDHFAVGSGCFHQLGMRADFGDASLFKDEDAVGVSDGAEPVRDDEARPFAHEFCEAALDELFAFGVEVAGGFVKNEDPGIREECAGDGDSLTLSAAEAHPALADPRFVLEFEFLDEFGGIGQPGGAADLVERRVFGAVADVFGDCPVKEENILFDDAEQSAVAVDFKILEIDSVERDDSLSRIEEAGDEVAEGGFSSPAGTDEGDHFPQFDFEVDVLEDRGGIARIGERDIAESDGSANFGAKGFVDAVATGQFERFVEEVKDAIQSGEAGLESGSAVCEDFQGAEEHGEIEEEHRKVTQREFVAKDRPAAVEHQGHAEDGEGDFPEDFDASRPGPGEEFLASHEVVSPDEAGSFAALLSEGPNDAHAAEGFSGMSVDFLTLLADIAEHGAEASDPGAVRDIDEREQKESPDEQPPIDEGENHEAADELNDGTPGIVEEAEDKFPDGTCVFAKNAGDTP